MTDSPWFVGRTAAIATRHGKEAAIAPLLAELGVQVVVPPDFDSDRFGTFTRDVARHGTQLEAARAKAKAALELTGGDLAIASEGSFGPHPLYPLVPGDRELVLWFDRAHNLEIVGLELTTETNYAQQTVASVEEALAFAARVGFPDHWLVARPNAATQEASAIYKGINDRPTLTQIVADLCARSPDGTAWLETDMRAHGNPMRMRAIARATENLLAKLRQRCPRCDCPGFEIAQRQLGLPCSWCGTPTTLSRLAIQICQRCGHREEQLHPDGLPAADPAHCPQCNP